MAVKNSNKRYMTKQEHGLRKLMTEHRVSQSDIANYEDISISAVSLRLKSLTPSMLKRLKDIILELSHKTSHKAAS